MRVRGSFPTFRAVGRMSCWCTNLATEPTGTSSTCAIDRFSAIPPGPADSEKIHTSCAHHLPKADHRWRELDSCMSSNALLMNVFCYPRCLKIVCSMLGLGIERIAAILLSCTGSACERAEGIAPSGYRIRWLSRVRGLHVSSATRSMPGSYSRRIKRSQYHYVHRNRGQLSAHP